MRLVSRCIISMMVFSGLLLFWLFPLSGGESQSLWGYLEIGTTGADTSNGLWLRTYIAMPPNNIRPKELQEVAVVVGSDPYFGDVDVDTKYWIFDAGNFPTAQATGDSVIVLIDWEEDTGSKTHKGYYAVMNDTILKPDENPIYELSTCFLRVMPTPNTVSPDIADLVWNIPTQDNGVPVTDNIMGYNIYRSLKSLVGAVNFGISFPEQLNSSVLTSPSYKDYTHPGGGDSAYYAYRIVYRPDTTITDASDGYESLFLSPNSPAALSPPAAAIELSGYSGYSALGKVFIKWRTESEDGNLAWRIDRSQNPEARFEIVHYEKDDEPTTPGPTEYCFVDRNVSIGKTYYYKLADIGMGGKITWYNIITVKVSGKNLPIEPVVKPNPFEEHATIGYTVTNPGDVSLKVVDIRGRVVTTLFNGYQKEGIYTKTWDGKDSRKNKVPEGIYFFHLEAAHWSYTGKIVKF